MLISGFVAASVTLLRDSLRMGRRWRVRVLGCTAFSTLLVVAIVGCGGDPERPGTKRTIPASAYHMTSPPGYRPADARFVQGLYFYREQALQLMEGSTKKPVGPTLRAFLGALRPAHEREVILLSSWLRELKIKVPDLRSSPAGTKDEYAIRSIRMTALEHLTGRDYERELVGLLIKNQQGAVHAATAEQHAGAYTPAVQLAGQVTATGTGTIVGMRRMLWTI